MLKRFASYFKPYKKVFVLDLCAAFLVAGIDLLYPMITRALLNSFIKDKLVTAVLISAGILIVLYLAKWGLNFYMGYCGHVMSAEMQRDMRRDLFRHLESLPVSFFDKSKTGVLISRATGDLQDVSELAHHGPEDIFTSAVLLIGATVIMVQMNLPLTILVLCTMPVIIFLMARSRRQMKVAMRASRVRMGEMSATLENSLTGIRVTKAYHAEENENAHFQTANVNYFETRREVSRALGGFQASMAFSADLLYWLILLAGGLLVIYTGGEGGFFSLNYVDLVAFMLYVNVFMQPVRKLANFVEQYQNGMSGFAHFCELMDAEPESTADGHIELGRADGDILFDHVTFAYGDGDDVLRDVTLAVPRGKTLALVGPSGGGKTTLCHLIPRFYKPKSGRILLDGHDVRDLTLSSLRQNVGIVAQDLFLFDATIYDNIAYGRVDATPEEVYNAARLANLEEFILSLPNGYMTEVGERGVRLSGGQKQRVSIARAFLKNPPVLILDEATSALDTVTERMIQESLSRLSVGRTVIVVAHRLSTIRNADEIAVIDMQGVVERGTHESLMAAGGVYASLSHVSDDESV